MKIVVALTEMTKNPKNTSKTLSLLKKNSKKFTVPKRSSLVLGKLVTLRQLAWGLPQLRIRPRHTKKVHLQQGPAHLWARMRTTSNNPKTSKNSLRHLTLTKTQPKNLIKPTENRSQVPKNEICYKAEIQSGKEIVDLWSILIKILLIGLKWENHSKVR